MEEARNVKLTKKEAKQWYSEGGIRREIALRAFDESELKVDKPETWKEYCEQSFNQELYYIDVVSNIINFVVDDESSDSDELRNTLPSEELARKFRAYMQLMSLREAWLEGYNDTKGYGILFNSAAKKFVSTSAIVDNYPLCFPTQQMAEKFIDCFKDLLEEAKGLF